MTENDCSWYVRVLLTADFYNNLFVGVGYQPWLIEDPDSTLIKFNVRDKSSYKKYVEKLDSYLLKYANTTATRVCIGNQSNADLFTDNNIKADNLPDDSFVKVHY